jgi:L-threonylcarbamoyladenylate synthase
MQAPLELVDRAVAILRRGGLVAFPTETVYGLGADAENPAAVRRIFAVKGRPAQHPLIVHIADAAELQRWVREVPAAAVRLARRFWPGPLTLVLWRSERIPLEVTGGLETVALRVPAHRLALQLLQRFGGPIAAPSANRFGSVSPTTAEHVRDDLGDAVDLVLDGGPCKVGIESTIVDLSGSNPAVLRPGAITREELEEALAMPVEYPVSASVRAPGQHPLHYAPRARVILVTPDRIAAEAARQSKAGCRVGVLAPPELVLPASFGGVVREVPPSLEAYAHELYTLLREFDRRNCDVIVAALPPEEGLGSAIADRLRRAAGPRQSQEELLGDTT